MVEGYQCDFARAIELIKTEHRSAIEAKGNWGHLVIDEAQDFAPDAHRMLRLVSKYFDNLPAKERPSILILADENQRLQEHHNSTLEEIEEAYLLGDNDIYKLRKNYRNTLEIANLATEFYTGLPTGVPESPTRRGDKPKLIATKDLNDVVDRIERHAKAHENEEVGVLVQFDATRRKLFNRLKKRFEGTKVTVQTYSSHKKDPNNDATKLHFDKKGTITVLCFASSKGLEFDTVFLPELQEISVGDGNVMSFRMNMYVMISRARERLFLMASDPESVAPIWQHLPLDKKLLDT
jgi:superfamily I DNA/RNA helicase